jgi:hypothetical protein
MRISRSERWGVLDSATAAGPAVKVLSFQPGDSGLPYLDRVAALFDTYMCRRLRVLLKSASGTLQSGMVHMGIDYDARRLPSTEVEVLGTSQLLSVPIWKSGTVSPDLSIVNRGGWRPTWSQGSGDTGFYEGPSFAVCTSNNSLEGTAEIWLDYDLEFKGFSPLNGGPSPSPSGSMLQTKLVMATWSTAAGGPTVRPWGIASNGPGTDFGENDIPWSFDKKLALEPPLDFGGVQIDVHGSEPIRSVGLSINFNSTSFFSELYETYDSLEAFVWLREKWVKMLVDYTVHSAQEPKTVSLNYVLDATDEAWSSDGVQELSLWLGGPSVVGVVQLTDIPIMVVVSREGFGKV